MKKQRGNRKFYFGATVILVAVVILGYMMQVPKEEKVAKQFLTQLYQVESHERYLSFKQKMDTQGKIQGASQVPLVGSVVAIPEEVFQEYSNLYEPLMTEKSYEQFFANATYLYADQFAAENGYLFNVKKIELEKSATTSEVNQYVYTVKVETVFEEDKKSETIVVEGSIGIKKDVDGVFRVTALKKYIQNEYDMLLK